MANGAFAAAPAGVEMTRFVAGARRGAPAARHAWWLAETFVRSMHPGWTNPYERVSGAADASDGGGEIDRRHRRPPPRPADPGRGPHQFR